jgi:hypothetical protein
MVRSEGNMSLKNPVTPPGIDPGTVRLVAQRLKHYANTLTQGTGHDSTGRDPFGIDPRAILRPEVLCQ